MAVCAAVRRNPVAIFALVLTSSLGKETLAPFVLALVLICARSHEDALLPRRRLTLTAMAAAACALALNSAFNVFRFGTVQNLLYLDAPLHTPGVARKLEFFSAVFVSPSAGILWFWPFFSAIALFGTTIGLRRLFGRSNPSSYLPVLTVTGVMLLWVATLSTWFSPFGWIAYGPRLEVPLLGGLAVAYVHTAGDAMIRAIRKSRALRISGVVLLVAGSFQFFAPWRYAHAIDQLILGRGSCPDMTRLDIYGSPATFYRCAHEFMWRIRPSVFDDLLEIGLTWSSVAWLAAFAACVALWSYVAASGGGLLRSESVPAAGRRRMQSW